MKKQKFWLRLLKNFWDKIKIPFYGITFLVSAGYIVYTIPTTIGRVVSDSKEYTGNAPNFFIGLFCLLFTVVFLYIIYYLSRAIYLTFKAIYLFFKSLIIDTMNETEYKSSVWLRNKNTNDDFVEYKEYIYAVNETEAENKIRNKYEKKFDINKIEISKS